MRELLHVFGLKGIAQKWQQARRTTLPQCLYAPDEVTRLGIVGVGAPVLVNIMHTPV